MTENEPLDIGEAAQWATALRSLDEPVEKMPVADIQLVVRVSLSGPRSPEEGLRVLTDPALRQLLLRTWREEPPDDDLRAQLQGDVVGRDLLALVTPSDPHPGPTLWSRIAAAVAGQLTFTPLSPVVVGGAPRSPRDPNEPRSEGQATVTMRARIASGGRVTLRKTGSDRWAVTLFKQVQPGDVLVISWPHDEHQLLVLQPGDHSSGLALGELTAPAEDVIPKQVYVGQPPTAPID